MAKQWSSHRGFSRCAAAGFTLVELLVSVSLLSFLMIILAAATDSASRAWREGQGRTDTFQSARTALELLARELSASVVDTRSQMVVAPGSILTAAGAKNIATNSPAILCMAPLGDEGSLRCVGYYLYRDDNRGFYRLKRIFIGPNDASGNPSPYYPQTVNGTSTTPPSAIDASSFTRTWDFDAFNDNPDPKDNHPYNKDKVVVSCAADGVIALWIQCLDTLGNAVPLVSNSTIHPSSTLFFNSAAYFEEATTTPFDGGFSFAYLAQTAQSLKANRLPAALEIFVVLLDSATLARGVKLPPQQDVFDSHGALDMKKTLDTYQASLRDKGIQNARTFSTRTKLINGS